MAVEFSKSSYIFFNYEDYMDDMEDLYQTGLIIKGPYKTLKNNEVYYICMPDYDEQRLEELRKEIEEEY